MFDNCIREIEGLHRFFMEWIGGRIEKTAENFERFTSVIADDFEIISPGGTRMDRDEIVPFLFDWHGSRDGEETYRIWIEHATPRIQEDDTLLLTYDECQVVDGKPTRRFSTVLFTADPNCLNGVTWRHVHETWVIGQSPED